MPAGLLTSDHRTLESLDTSVHLSKIQSQLGAQMVLRNHLQLFSLCAASVR